jgi:copper(I)-binding protein
MYLFRLLLALGFALSLASCGASRAATEDQDAIPAGSLRISHAWMRTPNEAAEANAVYLVIRNTGAEEDQLVGATADVAATVELHQSLITNGVVAMRPVKGIPIPAGGAVAIESGSYHLMLLNRTRLAKPGDTIGLILTFARAGAVSLRAEVRDAAPATDPRSDGSGGHQH